jgi:hypothetical protein
MDEFVHGTEVKEWTRSITASTELGYGGYGKERVLLCESKDGHDHHGHGQHHAHDRKAGSCEDRWECERDRDAKMKVAP